MYSYFEKCFAGEVLPLEEDNLEVITPNLTEELNLILCREPSMEELKKTLDGMNKEAAPGPDGYTLSFYLSCWDLIKFDLLEAVIDFFKGSAVPNGFGHTFIALIPKKEITTTWADFRPICLCNNFLKLLSKILNERLNPYLPLMITENQSGFVKGRSIADNILLTQELILALDHRVRGANLVLKLDMLKAYDRVNWIDRKSTRLNSSHAQ